MITFDDFQHDPDDEWGDDATSAALTPQREPGVVGHPVIEDAILGATDASFDDGEPLLIVVRPMLPMGGCS